MTKRIGILCFSPTNTTRIICNAIVSGMGSDKPLMLDITLPDTRAEIIANGNTILDKIDHLIVGAPVYSGKLPLQAIECLKTFNGTGKTSTAIVVYGNRDYGISLYHMIEILSKNYFNVIAAGTFIGQHSYSDIVPVAMGRPDKSDIEKARKFGTQILHAIKPLNLNDIPLKIDKHSKSKKYFSIKPSYNKKLCIKCGKCAKVCPSGILSSDTGKYLDRSAKKNCIGCMACVNNCKPEARILKVSPIVQMIISRILGQASIERKEPFLII
ncbi:MAG: 4Fe-4S binding protein [Spirochaetes bacterium]|nr:4Fe-4S binding protein [Spirochaetota bacterium]